MHMQRSKYHCVDSIAPLSNNMGVLTIEHKLMTVLRLVLSCNYLGENVTAIIFSVYVYERLSLGSGIGCGGNKPIIVIYCIFYPTVQ